MKSYLQEILNKKNISVNQLHKLTGISRTTLDPLTKTNKIPPKTRVETLERISSALQIFPTDLYSLDDIEIVSIDFELLPFEKDEKPRFLAILHTKWNDLTQKIPLFMFIQTIYPPEYDYEEMKIAGEYSVYENPFNDHLRLSVDKLTLEKKREEKKKKLNMLRDKYLSERSVESVWIDLPSKKEFSLYLSTHIEMREKFALDSFYYNGYRFSENDLIIFLNSFLRKNYKYLPKLPKKLYIHVNSHRDGYISEAPFTAYFDTKNRKLEINERTNEFLLKRFIRLNEDEFPF